MVRAQNDLKNKALVFDKGSIYQKKKPCNIAVTGLSNCSSSFLFYVIPAQAGISFQ